MTQHFGRPATWLSRIAAICVGVMCCVCLCTCTNPTSKAQDTSDFLAFLDVEPSTVDPQCTSENYTVALNVFDRLVEIEDTDGQYKLVPSLAESWEVSDDGLTYTFHLRKGVRFSDGSRLTSADVGFTLRRLISNPNSRNRDLAMGIRGAAAFQEGQTDELEGFEAVDNHTFTVTLERPLASFLWGLSTPGASILDEDATTRAADKFGTSPRTTVGTGPFILSEWTPRKRIIMTANTKCWTGGPNCSGLNMMFYSETDPLYDMFSKGKIDLLDLDKLGMDAEYFLRGESYRTMLVRGRRVGITYLALNESVGPLSDVRVRKALQLSLDREAILQATVGGRGSLENGIYPRGLTGYNPDLPQIPYDPDKAVALLREAGYGEGFDLTISHSASSPQSIRDLLALAASMWQRIGVRTTITELSDDEFDAQRSAGKLACYTATWSADYNDPDNFIYTFFGTTHNTTSRSLCYPDEQVMARVQAARSIVDAEERIAEYQDLERKIVQEDAAWIPLYSRMHFFVVGDRIDGFRVRWNGWSSNRYDKVFVTKASS